MQSFDYVIVGSGIVGLTIARALKLKQPESKVVVLEKELSLGLHGSGRNSGVVHSGIYYPPGSLKAKICVEGSKSLMQYCVKNKLPLDKMGKVIVSTRPENDSQVDFLYDRAIKNGVEVNLISSEELKQIEPHANLRCDKALHSPNTAVVDPKKVLDCLQDEITQLGVVIQFGSKVIAMDPDKSEVKTTAGTFSYTKLFNAAGQYSDKIADLFQVGKGYTMLPFRGQYYKLKNAHKFSFNGLIYPVPDLNVPFLGVHTVKTVDGDIYFGPSAVPALGRENYTGLKSIELDDCINILRQLGSQFYHNNNGFRAYAKDEIASIFEKGFVQRVNALVPEIKESDVVRSNKVGIRAQLVDLEKKELVNDFLVEKKENTVHILNAVSPAFTCSFSFSEWLIDNF